MRYGARAPGGHPLPVLIEHGSGHGVLIRVSVAGAPIVHAQPWPGASFAEEQPEPGAGIRIALALERAARAGVRVYIQRAREAGMSWAEVGEALGVAELARARGSSLAGAAWEY